MSKSTGWMIGIRFGKYKVHQVQTQFQEQHGRQIFDHKQPHAEEILQDVRILGVGAQWTEDLIYESRGEAILTEFERLTEIRNPLIAKLTVVNESIKDLKTL